jgi:imidazoleglycerol-phosphate dehydratase/histidinol-phosphatase
MKRTAKVVRKTTETNISVSVELDGTGKYEIDTGVGFLNHMLELFSKHSLIDIELNAKGDLEIDEHHTVEDTGIVLGQAIAQALGDKRGIERYGFLLPMDEALAEVALDLGGRAYFVWDVEFQREKIGDMPSELFEDFFQAFADNLKANLQITLRRGRNEHHKAEAIFKAVARAMRFAISRDERNAELMPSTKGSL